MNLTMIRPARAKLSLPFGGRIHSSEPASVPGSATLPDHELRRIVAAMIG
jgi:hypothetical protein